MGTRQGEKCRAMVIYVDDQELGWTAVESRAGQRPAALVVLLHGYGANGDDLIPLGR